MHICESLVERRYSFSLKARYGEALGGILFVGEEIDEDLSASSPLRIMETWRELTGINTVAVNTRDFARILVSKALKDVKCDRSRFSQYDLSQIPSQLHALTTTSDGYPQWFDQEWYKRMADKYFPICR